MKFATVVLLGIIAATASAEPIVSVNKTSALLKSSFELAGDLAYFTSDKFESALTGEPKKIYQQFLRHAKEYRAMVSEWIATSYISHTVKNVAGVVLNHVEKQYERINTLSGRIVDPIVTEFEKQFPSSKGKIGESVLDRMLLATWLVWLAKKTMCVVGMVFRSRRVASKL